MFNRFRTQTLAGLALIRHPAATLAAFERAWRMLALGGILVRTPDTEDALIATTVQLDGDLVTVVRRDLFTSGDAQRAARLDQHVQDLRKAVVPLAPVEAGIGAVRAAMLMLAAALQGTTLIELLLARGQLGQHVASLLSVQLPALVAYVLHRSVPPFLRWRLRARLAPVLRDWRATSESHAKCLIARQAQRAG